MEAATAGNQDLERLEKQKSQLVADKAAAESKAKQTFAFHLPSLGMLPVEEQKFENEEAQAFFSQLDKTGDVEAASTLVERNLGVKGNRLQSLLLEQFELGTLASVLPGILSYSMQKAEEHRSKARDVFNDVGGQLFANLDQSPITTLSLDTDYRLTIMKSDGSQTGVSALSGGESALVACALLMAVQKAYAPEAPVLLIDSVLDNLNNEAKQSLCNFLSEYAAQENIAIVATELADGITTPQLTDLHRSFWSWIGSYTVEEGNFVSNMTVDWGSRSADEISLLRQAWCAVDPEPPHIGATSWVDLKSRRDAVWSQMVDWCVGNSVTVDQNSIVIARQVMHHLIQEAVQAKRQREISDRPGTTLITLSTM